ncbi:chemotaxis protein CheW [uncultured Hydrogenophaga sp.]|uniref:chemotaxis protein CheW n=1 Tax=uncultured Hydrogenophaga sp. TaxID=199683 RepID=UPI00265DAAD1|nr:chemotaxis protein CheW [uncultured Hydrogenophaga sp.]
MRADNPSQQPEDGDCQFVTFSAAGERFAVPMGPVQEIIRLPEVARLPMAPPALEGLANLRGRILPIIDLRRVLGVPVPESSDATRALVIHIGQPLGFVVDHVASVIHASAQQVESAQSLRSVVDAELLTGVIRQPREDGSDDLLLVLDFNRLVHDHFRTQGPRGDAAVQAGGGAPTGAADEEQAADEVRLVSFTVDGQEYAVDIADVQEIVQMPSRVTTLHNVPPHVLGLMSLRRRLLPLVSLRALFGLTPVAADEQQRIVVVGRGDTQIGLVTDTVKEVLGVPRNLTEGVPPLLSRTGDLGEFSAICRLEGGRRLVSVIDAERLLGLPAIQAACQAIDAAGHLHEEASDEDPTMHESAKAAADQDLQMVIFRLGAEEFGVPIMSVQEIVRVPEVLTRVPQTPAFVEGVMNLRGMVLPVVDQRRRLAMEPIERNDRQRIMVYTFGGMRTGFIVDSVAEVMKIEGAHVEQAPDLGEAQRLLFSRVAKIDGGKRLVMLIDPDRLLDHRDRSQLALQHA